MKTLLVILGPTGVGKTALAIDVAERLGTEIVNADSRQIYKELPIGTAAPTKEEQARVRHWFVGTRSIQEDYNAGMYEREALEVIGKLFEKHDTVVMTGGSMMYIDAVCKGLDELPTVSKQTREEVRKEYEAGGMQWLRQEVEKIDPEYFAIVDKDNPQRLLHAVEITRQAGVPYSTLRSGKHAKRDFRIVQVGLTRDRADLYNRIDARVIEMMSQGLEAEASRVLAMRGLNSLNTVGYKEMFAYFDGEISREEAIRLIQQHSRNYAKRQMTWWRNRGKVTGDRLQVTGDGLRVMGDGIPQNTNQQFLSSSISQFNNPITWFDAEKVTTDDIIALL